MARGKLRLYLGAAPGVGKTYAMLNEGWRRKERGTDVVIGWVQDHGRPHTDAQIRDLEIFPRRTAEYRGQTLEEMDLDGLLRAPARAGAGGRAGPHQRARIEARQAMAGRRGAPRRRHQRHLDDQPAAPRVAQRRGRGDHRGGPARDGARPGGPGRRPAGAGRHGPRGAAQEAGPRQRLPARAHRRRPGQLLPHREPHRPPRAGPPVGGRPGRRGAQRLPRAPQHRRAVGDQGAGGGLAHRLTGQRRAHPACGPDGHADQGRARRGARPHRRQPDRTGVAGPGHQPRPARRPGRALCRSGGGRRGAGPGAGGQGGERHPTGDGGHPPEPVERVPPRLGHQLGHPGRRRLAGRPRHRHRRGDARRLTIRTGRATPSSTEHLATMGGRGAMGLRRAMGSRRRQGATGPACSRRSPCAAEWPPS